MSRFSPQVLPEYQGGDVGGRIAQAFMQRDQLNRQKDLDAVQTGVGLQPISQDQYNNPEPSGFMHTVRGALAKVRGEANPDDTAHVGYVRGMLNNMAGQNASVNSAAAAQTAQTGQPVMPEQPNGTADGFSAAQPKTPGAFNPMTGGFGPSVARYAKLPSGQTVDMAYTPFGEKLQQAMLTNQLNQTLLGIRGNQRLEQIGAQGENQGNVANIRGGYQVQTAGIRANQSNVNNIRTTQQSAANHATPSGSTIYSTDHRAASGTSSAIQPLVHQSTLVNKQLSDTQGQINTINKLPELNRHSTRQDSTDYNAAKASIPRLRQRADSLRGVLDKIGADMNKPRADASGLPPDPADQYELYRNQGLSHDDAVNAVMQSGAVS